MLRASRLDGVKALRQIGLLDSLTLDDLSQLYHFCTPCTFEPGEMVLREGENDDYMVFALSGRLEVLGEYACTIPSPDYIGQDGISPFVQRNASVRACDRVVALRLARRDFVDVYDAFAATPLAAELDRIVQDVGLRDMAHLREYLRDVEVRRPAIAPAAAAPAGPRFAAGSASSPQRAASRPQRLPSRQRIAQVVGLRGCDASVLFRKLRALQPDGGRALDAGDFVRCIARVRRRLGVASDAPRDAEAEHALALLHACVSQSSAGSGGATCAALCYACVATLALVNTCAAVFEITANVAAQTIGADDVRALLVTLLAVARACGENNAAAPSADAAEAEAMLNRARGDTRSPSVSFARFSAAFKQWMQLPRFSNAAALDPSRTYYVFAKSRSAAATPRHLSYSINRPRLYEDTGDVDDLVAWALRPVPGTPGAYTILEPKFGKHLVHDGDAVVFRTPPLAQGEIPAIEAQWLVDHAPANAVGGGGAAVYSVVARAEGRQARRDALFLARSEEDEEAVALRTGEALVLRHIERDVAERIGQACPSIATDFASHRVVLRRPIVFEKGRDELAPGSREVLRQLADVVQASCASSAARGWPPVRMQIEGHVNNVDNPRAADMIELSQSRAELVVEHLVALGVDARVLVARGFGGARPLRSGDSKRVEVTLVSETEQPAHHREASYWRIVETSMHAASGTREADDALALPPRALPVPLMQSLLGGGVDNVADYVAAGFAVGMLALLPKDPLSASAAALVKECYAGLVHHGPAITSAVAREVASREQGECAALHKLNKPAADVCSALGPAVERLKLLSALRQPQNAQLSEDVSSAAIVLRSPRRERAVAAAPFPARDAQLASAADPRVELERLAQLGRLRAELAASEREQAKLQRLAASLRHTATAQQAMIRAHEKTIERQGGVIQKLQESALGSPVASPRVPSPSAKAVSPPLEPGARHRSRTSALRAAQQSTSPVSRVRRVQPLFSPPAVPAPPAQYGALVARRGTPQPLAPAKLSDAAADWRPHAFLFLVKRRALFTAFRDLREQCMFYGRRRKRRTGWM